VQGEKLRRIGSGHLTIGIIQSCPLRIPELTGARSVGIVTYP